MQAIVIEPPEVLDDRELHAGACRPGTIADELGLEGVHEGLGDRVIQRVADRADRLQDVVVVKDLGVVVAGVLTPASEWTTRATSAPRWRWVSAIRSAARLNKFAPCTASRPRNGARHARIRHGMYASGNAPVLNSTIRSSRTRIRSIAPRPIAPPQSCAMSVTRSSRKCSTNLVR